MDMTFSRAGERGNVLFLVLIAVVLFAALSYAVTSSTRQPGSKPGELDAIGAAELNQYPAMVRMAAMTMMVEGVGADELEFNGPADFASLSNASVGIFHPSGGGASYQAASPNVMASGAPGQWYFNAEFEIDNLGLDTASDFEGNDVIAFLPGVKKGVCERINDRVGISSAIPDAGADLSGFYTVNMDENYVLPAGETLLGAAGGNGTDSLTGQPFACFRNNGGDYVYYQVLIER